MNFAIDTFTVVHGCVVVAGWAVGAPPDLRAGGTALPSSVVRHRRPDLVPHFGAKAEAWGFRLVGVSTADHIDPATLTLHWPDGTVTTPADATVLPRPRLPELLAAFRARVAERGGRFLEIGSRARSGNSYRHLFPAGIDYVGLDVTAGPNVDVVADAHHLSRAFGAAGAPFDFVFSVSVFEHLVMPWKAALEMNAVMRVGGLAYIQSHPTWPLHEEPWDFWRFSGNGWRGLFNAHTGFRVLDVGYDVPGMVVPLFATPGATDRIEAEPTFLTCACLVEKTGAPRVRWDAETGEVFDVRYAHA